MVLTEPLIAPSGSPMWASVDASVQYEYLEHTADVQIHSWGADLAEAFEQQVTAMMGMITELPSIQGAPAELGASSGQLLPW